MKFEHAKQLAGYLGAKTVTHRQNWAVCECPFAPWKHEKGSDSNPSFGIRLEEGKEPIGFCFSCSTSGPLTYLIEQLKHLVKKDGVDKYPQYQLGKAAELLETLDEDLFIPEWSLGGVREGEELIPFPEWWLDSFQPAWGYEKVRNYLISRGVSEALSHGLDLRADFGRDAVCFPLRDFEGRLMGMRGRYIQPFADGPRFHDYKHQGVSNTSRVWLGEQFVDPSKPLVIVEGNFDYAKVFGFHRNVVAAQTASVSREKIMRLASCWSLILFLDNDMAGKGMAEKLRKYLDATCVIEEVVYPEGAGKDPGALSESQIRDLLKPLVQ